MNWLTGLIGVIRSLVDNSGIPPSDKTSLHSALDTVQGTANGIVQSAAGAAENLITDAPAIAQAGADEAIGATASLVPGGSLVAPAVEAVVGPLAGGLVSTWLGIIEKHNQALMTELKAAANPPA